MLRTVLRSIARPRTGPGRVALFWAGYIAILVVASIPKGMVPAAWGQVVWGATSALAILALTLLSLSRDGLFWRDGGLTLTLASPLRFAGGVVLGLAIYGVNIFAVSLIAGPIHLTPAAAPARGAILLSVATFLALSTMEELGFRGYPLRTLIPALGRWRAQGIVAIGFALSHAAFGWPWQTILLGVLPSAFLFGAAALASRGLAMPIGLHAALNIASWAVGGKDAPGLWTMAVAEGSRGRVAAVAPFIGVVITAAAAIALWRCWAPPPEAAGTT